MISRYLVVTLSALSVLVPPAGANAPGLAYRQETDSQGPNHDAESPAALSHEQVVRSRMPERPLAHPIVTFRELNRDGLKVLNEPGALPYVAIGILALATDKQTERWFSVSGPGEPRPKFSKTFNHFGDGKVLLPACALMYVVGRDEEKGTAKLWAAAMVNATFWSQSLKMLSGKERPNRSPDAITYHGPSSLKYDSFPSGHMTIATASAVVLGHEYPRMKLVFYSLAACVGIARIRGADHWPSDVYWGAGVGYYGGRQALLNRDAILKWRF